MDIIKVQYPEKLEECNFFFKSRDITSLDVIKINRIIFGAQCFSVENFDQQHRSYSKSDILKILDYQKKNKLNNSQLALYFKLSRSTVTKWRKIFL
jgi:hypothetical protein